MTLCYISGVRLPDGIVYSPSGSHVISKAAVASTNSTDLGVRFNAAPGVATVECSKRGAAVQQSDSVTFVVRATVPRGDIPIQCYQSDRVFLVTNSQRREGDHVKWRDLLTELVARQLVMVGSRILGCDVRSKNFYICGNASPLNDCVLSGFYSRLSTLNVSFSIINFVIGLCHTEMIN